ncbi:MAG TPA: ABC transporter ATP-binding protein [Burkholderiaceae bacterium]|nr:ABC transporter ATP-binding protein [Burkholderiaceae bacterium]
MLDVRAASAAYGKHRALFGVDLAVARGELIALLGANGAGKSTLLKVVSGLVEPESTTQVLLDGRPLHTLPAHERVEAGLALVPEGRGIFGDLTVRENLELGAYAHRARGPQERNLERVLALFPRLKERLRQAVRTMSGGEQQMVAIGRALMAAPRVLLLDEPSIGLSPLLCTELFKAIAAVRDGEVGILLVEQNARRSLAIADRAYLLENGRIAATGTAEALAADPAIRRAYLGLA